MSTIGQIEKKTQQRVVKLFRDTLGYAYLGNWAERYATPLPQLTGEVATLAVRVDEHLKKMGAVWK